MANRKVTSKAKSEFVGNDADFEGTTVNPPEFETISSPEIRAAKRNRKPQEQAPVSIFVADNYYNTRVVYAKQGRSIIGVYFFISATDLFIPVAPTQEIAKAWLSEFDKVKSSAILVGQFQHKLAANVSFVHSLVTSLSTTTEQPTIITNQEPSN